jgi:hypothetical protein
MALRSRDFQMSLKPFGQITAVLYMLLNYLSVQMLQPPIDQLTILTHFKTNKIHLQTAIRIRVSKTILYGLRADSRTNRSILSFSDLLEQYNETDM